MHSKCGNCCTHCNFTICTAFALHMHRKLAATALNTLRLCFCLCFILSHILGVCVCVCLHANSYSLYPPILLCTNAYVSSQWKYAAHSDNPLHTSYYSEKNVEVNMQEKVEDFHTGKCERRNSSVELGAWRGDVRNSFVCPSICL